MLGRAISKFNLIIYVYKALRKSTAESNDEEGFGG